jgi:thiol-disulfide isomerase/thioredoxin
MPFFTHFKLNVLLCSQLLLFGSLVLAQKPCSEFQLQGSISNADGQWLYIKNHDYETYHLLDSVQVKNGTISVSLSFNEPTNLLLLCGEARAISTVNCGVNSFTWDITQLRSFSMKNNGVNEYRQEYLQSIEGFNNSMVELSKQIRAAVNNQAAQDSLMKLKDDVQEKYPIVTRAFIRKYSNNFVALDLLRYHLSSYPVDTIRALYTTLSETLKHYPAARTIKEYLDLEKKQLPLNTLSYTSGKDSVAGYDYYVVDFWGSWCGPCIASIPAVKELYKEYRAKNIQFISVAYEKKDLERYYTALEKHQMPWPQSYVLEKDNERTLIDEFYITAFPTYLLLDKSFQIRHRIIGSHEELAAVLKKL